MADKDDAAFQQGILHLHETCNVLCIALQQNILFKCCTSRMWHLTAHSWASLGCQGLLILPCKISLDTRLFQRAYIAQLLAPGPTYPKEIFQQSPHTSQDTHSDLFMPSPQDSRLTLSHLAPLPTVSKDAPSTPDLTLDRQTSGENHTLQQVIRQSSAAFHREFSPWYYTVVDG
ncbi:hypothetical protein Bbelb_332020 [Branchiostoma belcheri]|nr:hypothetical protein Bbelb_332020 [Branchiostoma belcheri]